jgi:hypothetical protein
MNSGTVDCNNCSVIFNGTWWLPFSPFKQPVLWRLERFYSEYNWHESPLVTGSICSKQKTNVSEMFPVYIIRKWQYFLVMKADKFPNWSSFWVSMAEHWRFHHPICDVMLQKANTANIDTRKGKEFLSSPVSKKGERSHLYWAVIHQRL